MSISVVDIQSKWRLKFVENKALKQVEARLLTILDDETLGVDRDNVFLAIALVRKLASNEAIKNIHASPSDYGEIILDIELKNDCDLVLFLDYKENQATSYVETDSEIRACVREQQKKAHWRLVCRLTSTLLRIKKCKYITNIH